jgi:hypothetical protein
MTEAELQAVVMRLAASLGLICLHLRAPLREGDWTGFPDLWIIRPGGGPGAEMFRELKAPGKQPRASQREWQRLLEGRDVDVWKPHDWHTGRVRAELETLADRLAAVPVDHGAEARMWRALQRTATGHDSERIQRR